MKSPEQKGKIILLVEDQAIIAAATGLKLKKIGYESVIAYNGEEAVRKAAEFQEIALVLMDIDLGPGMNGPEAAAEILKTRDIPIVFLTSHAEKEYVESVKEITRYGYVIKNSGDFVIQSSIDMAFELFEAHKSKEDREKKLIQAESYSDFGSWKLNIQKQEFLWSNRMYDIYGISKSGTGITLEKHLEYVNANDLPGLEETMESAIKQGKDFQIDYRIKNPQLGTRWLSCSGQPVRNARGEIIEYDGIIQDITSRKEAENSLERIFELSSDLICVADINTATFVRINPAFTKLLGYTREELLSKPFYEFIHPDDLKSTQDVVEHQLKKNRNTLSFTNRYRKKNGEYCYLHWNSHPIAEEGRTYAIAHDFTDYIKVIEREKRLKRILESIRTINQTIYTANSKQELIENICRQMIEIAGYNHTWIVLLNDEKNVSNVSSYSRGNIYTMFERDLKKNMLPFCVQSVLKKNDMMIITDPSAECKGCICSDKDPPGQAKLCCKISLYDRIFGVMVVTLPLEAVLDDEEKQLFDSVIRDMSMALNRFYENELIHTDRQIIKKYVDDYQRLFRTMIDGYAIHKLIYDSDGKAVDYRFLDINPAFEKMLGLTRDMVVGKTVLEALPQTEQYWIDTYANVVKTGQPFTFTNYTRSFDKHFKVTAFTPAPDQFVTVFIDITDQVKANEELVRQKNLLERIMETSPVGITLLDKDGAMLFANTAAEEILGLRKDKITERRYADPSWNIRSVDGAEIDKNRLPYAYVMSTGKPVHDFRHSIELPDGSRKILSINGAPLKNRKGEIIRVVTVLSDITESVNSETQINELLAEKELLIREVHHRVKNDFSIINSLLQLQASKSSEKETVKTLQEASSRLSVMSSVYDILYQSDNIHKVNLDHIIRKLVENLRSTIITSDIKTTIAIKDISINAKTSVNTGIIVNELITNAVKYAFASSKPTEHPEIIISARYAEDQKLELSITDNGSGLPAEITKERKFGFGLFLVESLAHQHNGELEFRNGRGNTIQVTMSTS